MAETQYTPPFYPEDISALEGPLPFTTSFNLDEPSMIDLSLLDKQEKEALLKELEKRQNHHDASTSWTKDHVDLLFKLRAQLDKNTSADTYIPLKDRPRR